MTGILTSLSRTILAGFILLAAILLVFANHANIGTPEWLLFSLRWSHVLFGVMWLGLLWYFNVVQIPSMPLIPDEQKLAISKVIAPRALLWFRYAALGTVVTGLLVAIFAGYAHQAFTLQPAFRAIGLGMWIALFMAFNVWFVIWPNQKRALGIVPAEPAVKAASARRAMLVSRFNTILSIPMLYLMSAQSHGGL
jgi:uncharacterized membrane protein